MASWSDFAAAEPQFAARVLALLQAHKHKTMATLRADGSPRISGTETEIGDELRLGSMPGAVKARDLLRDPRVAIHGPTFDPPEGRPDKWRGEAKVTGRAIAEPSNDGSHRFRVDILEVVLTSLNDQGSGLLIESWHEGRGLEVHERM